MSCYNASRYLREAMDSVLTQTYRDYEFIVVNDGSTDDTAAILRTYASKDARIRIIEKANTGLTDSLNVGLHSAKGQWIARLDADDMAMPNRLTRQMAFVQQSTSLVVLGTGCTLVDTNGERIANYRYPPRHRPLVTHMASWGSPFPHSSALFHRDTALSIGGYNHRFLRCQDVDLWLRLSRFGHIGALPTPLVKIRKHRDNISSVDTGKVQAAFGMAARVCHLLQTQGAPDPSTQGNDIWLQFLEWLTARVAQSGLLERRSHWSRLKQRYLESPRRLVGAWHVLRGLRSFEEICWIIARRRYLRNLIREFTREWAMRENISLTTSCPIDVSCESRCRAQCRAE